MTAPERFPVSGSIALKTMTTLLHYMADQLPYVQSERPLAEILQEFYGIEIPEPNDPEHPDHVKSVELLELICSMAFDEDANPLRLGPTPACLNLEEVYALSDDHVFGPGYSLGDLTRRTYDAHLPTCHPCRSVFEVQVDLKRKHRLDHLSPFSVFLETLPERSHQLLADSYHRLIRCLTGYRKQD
jgi:hypothetical protein